ncbi:hypothetical protein MCOR27_009209 [Pyricularia oryzae]|uniref:Oxysterol-binding protein n=5 Tax=Pyricularia TaxID=48558 RepID=A0ABQ8NHI0_PYRGI|nr:uncharacterized protein MGG_13935 [Pyricularia oryzae 70-15]ELQ42244.1 hypothetical protein OOU_Y34scaffold00222g20 [Pyricularia oryzae Y34]KAH8844666.1 hypothetical protein MCOR01_005398 [Pyricularia oryzae]KAI6296216.1 hypothetical protein MCOR33_007112 [Pyricularia grisea]EHA49600.1 hypothetical protein MGG_13935 [Pyricularia oryzae 70-15]KAH9427787.1 hypothetical protein MCOR02_012019 [Pyricularia oryzae]
MDSKSLASRFSELVSFLSSAKGDLSNVTGPINFLAPCSVVEVGHCWAERPHIFAAPASEVDPARRALLVQRLVLSALRAQLYVAGAPGTSIKKPLNAFLGEVFCASWSDEQNKASTRLVAEQVSHHPPITAMHVSSGQGEGMVRADGYARVEMTFNGNVNIRQVGHALVRVERYKEDYLFPLPDVKVRGFLSACLYPEIVGTYHIIGSSGYISEIKFSGAGVLRGKRNSFEARLFHKADPKKTIFKTAGCWSEGWTVKDPKGRIVEEYNVEALENLPAAMELPPLEEQSPWESRRAWNGVIANLGPGGDTRVAAAEKAKLEQAQRRMRAEEKERGETWEPLLFASSKGEHHDAFHRLTEGTDWELCDDRTKGVWRIKDEVLAKTDKPVRGELTPLG